MVLKRCVSEKGTFTRTKPWKNWLMMAIMAMLGTMKVMLPFIMSSIAMGFIAAIGDLPLGT
jgi:hypothetical protein